MQYMKPLTHGKSLKIAQFCGKNTDSAILVPNVIRFSSVIEMVIFNI